MTVADLALQILWVAAHHGMRCHGVNNTMPAPERVQHWRAIYSITSALGNPPAPRGPR